MFENDGKNTIKVAITVLEDEKFPGVAKELERLGFEFAEKLPFIGIIIGRISPNRLYLLRNIPGVAAVEETNDFVLRPEPAKPKIGKPRTIRYAKLTKLPENKALDEKQIEAHHSSALDILKGGW